jgi:tetratricopeptide (TPR) repeat protein
VSLRSPPSHSRRGHRWPVAGVALCLATLLPAAAGAQRSRGEPEFTRQGLLVAPFALGPGTDRELGGKVSEQLRERLDDLLPNREVEMVRNDSVRAKLERAGFAPDSAASLPTLRQLSRSLRADEILVGTVARGPEGFRLTAQLVLARDVRLRQPYAPVTGPSLDAVTKALASTVAASRVQLAPQRRCENALREQKPADAVRAAREGVAAYPNGALVRTCLTQALRYGGAPATEVLEAARGVLAIDAGSAQALEVAAMALDSLHRRAEAADAWTRLFATDTGSLELGERVAWALFENDNAAAAEPIVLRLTASHPDLRLLQLQWRVANVNRHWPLAVTTGEALLERDPQAALDSAFVARLATVYETNGQRYQAVATAARGVAAIPGAAQLYALYTRLVRAEGDSALPRGLALFPRSAELLAMNAEALRAQGKLVEALAATRRAVAIDPRLPQGELSIAQAELDLGRPDSALASLQRIVARARGAAPTAAPPTADVPTPFAGGMPSLDGPAATPAASGPPTPPAAAPEASPAAAAPVPDARTRDSVLAMVAQFALAKGNTLLRAADATRRGDAFHLALGFLALADSLHPTVQSRFLVGTAALGVASAAVTEAAAVKLEGGGCEILRGATPTLALARAALEGGREVAPEAVEQYLGYLGQLDGFVAGQLGGTCGGGG